MRPLKGAITALVLCLGLIGAAPSFASGAQENRLGEARRLIQEKSYDEALLLLANIEAANPDLRDETRALIFQIMDIRRRYNAEYEKLIDVLNQMDLEKGLAIINELEALDPHPNPAMMSSIEQAKRGAENVFNAIHFRDIMDSAYKLIAQKKYAEALAAYLQPIENFNTIGFNLHRDTFLAAGYGDITVKNVLNTVGRISELAQGARAAAQDVVSAAAAAEALAGSKSVSGDEVPRFEGSLAVLQNMVDREAGLRSAVSALDTAGTAIQQKSADNRGDLYIQYMMRLNEGRKDREEGIVYAVHAIWYDAAQSLARATAADLSAAFEGAAKLLDGGQYALAVTALDDIPNRSLLAVKAASLQSAALRPQAGWRFTLQDGATLKELAGEAASFQMMAAESRAMQILARYRIELATIPPADGLSYRQLLDFRAVLKARFEAADSLRREWQAAGQSYGQHARFILSLGRLVSSAQDMADRFASFLKDLQGLDLGYAVRIAQQDSAGYPSRLALAQNLRAQASDDMEGTKNGLPTGAEIVYKYPSKALQVLDAAGGYLRQLTGDIDQYQTSWKSEQPYISTSPRISSLLAAAAEVSKQAGQERELVAALARKAQDQHTRALEQKKLGDQSFANAVSLSKTDPERAVDLLTKAIDAYGTSLQFEEDEAIRKRIETNGEIARLQTQISLSLNTRIVTDVEQLITDGIKLISSGDYLRANQKFTQADERWKEKHPGEMYSSVLSYYLDLSRSALTVSGSREILPTDPSYDVVSSYINLANQSYLSAAALLAAGRKADAGQALANAKRNVDAVLSLFPNYRVARILALKILNRSDEKAFPVQLQAQIAQYTQEMKSGKISKREAYLGLKDIQEFRPDDRALAATLSQLEIDIGLRAKPISPEQIRESNQAYQQAVDMYRANQPETYQPALQLLDKALDANPNNENARKQRTAILLRSGSPVQGAISSTALAEYLKAKELLNSGSVAEAKVIVDRLRQDPRNANYPPLVDLVIKINRALGI